MRRVELTTALPAPPARAWDRLTDTASWSEWGRFAIAARGDLTPGSVWEVDLAHPPRTMTPTLISVDPGRELVFETRFLAGLGARIQHAFVLETAPQGSRLVQRFELRGPLVWPLWSQLHAGVVQFQALGADLADALGRPAGTD